MTLGELFARMGSREISERMALDRVHPPDGQWLRSAAISSAITAASVYNFTRAKSTESIVPRDLLPIEPTGASDEPQSMEEGKAIMMAYVRAGKIREPIKV
jgi:hypothetical protein